MKLTRIYAGLNDRKVKTQIISTSDALNIVNRLCFELTDGATITTGSGVYKSNNNNVIENTIIIELLNCNAKIIYKIARILRKYLNQDSVLITEMNVNARFM